MNALLPFDRTFLLAMERDTLAPDSRTNLTLEHLRSEGIAPETFIGFDGSIAGLSTEHTYELDHPGTGYRIDSRSICCCLGHFAMWRMCEVLGGDSFLFLEDDVRFISGWREHLDAAMALLPDDWDLLYIGSCCCGSHDPAPVGGRLHRVNYALCTHAYAARCKALPVLRRACEKIYAGVDIAMCLHAIPRLNTYALLPRLADQFGTEIIP